MSDNEDDRYDEEREEGEEVEANEEGEEGEEEEETPPEPEEAEELPEEKPFTGEAEFVLPNGKTCGVRFLQPQTEGALELPRWLPYLISDDIFYFKRALKPVKEENDDDEERPEGESAPPPAEEPEGGDEEDEEQGPAVPFDANMKFSLQLYNEENSLFQCHVYADDGAKSAGDGEDDEKAEKNNAGGANTSGQANDGDEEDEEDGAARDQSGAYGSTHEDEAVEEVEEVETYIVDALTLAAVFSGDVLGICLQQPEVSLATLEAFAAKTVGHMSPVIDNLVAAQAAVAASRKKGSDKKAPRLAMDFAWLFNRQIESEELVPTMRSYVMKLIDANIVPSLPIPANLICNPSVARSYVHLLWQMPKSILNKFSLPIPTEDDPEPVVEEEEGEPVVKVLSPMFSRLLLDVRRRLARKKVGKRDLRNTSQETQAAFLPKNLEDKADPVVGSPYTERDYEPKSLVLYQSDLAILMLAMAPKEFGFETFSTLLDRKLAIPREKDANYGWAHLLLNSLTDITEPAARLVVEKLPVTVFEMRGPVNTLPWTKSVVNELFPYSMLVARKFWQVFASSNAVMNYLESNTACAEFYKAVTTFEDHFKVICHSTTNDNITEAHLQRYETEMLSPAVVCSPELMYVAIEARNRTVIGYLLQKGVVSARRTVTGKSVSVLEKVIRTGDADLTSFLVEQGMSLADTFDFGRFSASSYIQDNWGTEDGNDTEVTQTLVELFRSLENDRYSDPTQKFGLLRGRPAVVA